MNYIFRILSSVLLFLLLVTGVSAQSFAHGRIGLGTWKTQAEFRQVSVNSGDKMLYVDDFRVGMTGWPVTKGEWAVQDGMYTQMDMGEDRRAYVGDPQWGDYTLSLQARKLSGEEGFLIFFRVTSSDHYCVLALGGDGNTHHVLAKQVGEIGTRLAPSVPGHIEAKRWYDIRITVQGAHIRCWLDEALIQDVTVQPSSNKN
jgi:hypothetical protein